jgi:hypothetical protein
LDSDEPEEALVEAVSAAETGISNVTEPVVKKTRQRKTKPSKVGEPIGEDAAVTAATSTEIYKIAKKSTKCSIEKSAYFDQKNSLIEPERLPSSPPLIVCESHHADTNPEPGEPPTTEPVTDHPLVSADPAPRRRRSWTPAKDSFSENTVNTLPVVNQQLDETMQKVPFTELLGNFSYLQSEPASVQRTVSGEASTKRRRIELSEQIGVARPQDLEKSEERATSKVKAAPKAAKMKILSQRSRSLASHERKFRLQTATPLLRKSLPNPEPRQPRSRSNSTRTTIKPLCTHQARHVNR